MTMIRVAALWTFPEKGVPGRSHFEVAVGPAGLAGDRPKKAPISLVGRDAAAPRSNIVLDCANSEVESWDGRVVRVGSLTLAVTKAGTTCPGLYAVAEGSETLRVGDEVHLLEG